MKWYTRSCERPLKRAASEALPSSVSNRYSLSIRTQGNSCRRRLSSSLRRVSSFSAWSSSSRAASHSSGVPVLCVGMAVFSVVINRFSVREFGTPAGSAVGQQIEQVINRAEIVALVERRVGYAIDPLADAAEHRDARQPTLSAAIARIGGEARTLMRHHAEMPAARRGEGALRFRVVGRRHDKRGAVFEMRQDAVEPVGPHRAGRACLAHIVDDKQVFLAAEQFRQAYRAVSRCEAV